MLEEDTVWKCVFNLVYVHANRKGKDRGLKNQGYMIKLNKNPSYRPEFSAILGLAQLIEISVNRSIYKRKTIIDMKIQKSVTFNGHYV